MKLHLPVQAVAPEFGVRVIVEPDIVRVQASDSGGRGFPHFAVVVPICWRDPPLRRHRRFGIPGFGDLDERLLDWSELEKAGARILDKDGVTKLEPQLTPARPLPESPYFYRIERDRWPSHAPVLILLFYLQSPGIGVTVPAAPISNALRQLQNSPLAFENVFNQAAAAIAVLLARPAHELRGGLVEGQLPRADERADSISFALASCHYPSDILDRMPEEEDDARGPADASLLALGDMINDKTAGSPSLLLLAGDQVYTDATGGLFDPKILDDKYRIPYERRGASRGAQAVLQRADLEVRTMMDDHEISNNWEPPDPTDLRDRGKRNYFKFQRAHAACGPDDPLPPLYDSFEHRGFRFFMGDTRTERDGRTALNFHRAKIMSSEQFRDLFDWLAENRGRPKFVLTSTAVFPRRLAVSRDPANALLSDAWDGFPFSHHRLLRLLCEEQHEGVVFLSGDEHRCSFSTIDVENLRTGKKIRLHSIHSSALYAPYPFANGVEANFDPDDTFLFPHAQQGPYRCHAKTFFAPPGDGFVLVTAERRNAAWTGKVTFYGQDADRPKGSRDFTLI